MIESSPIIRRWLIALSLLPIIALAANNGNTGSTENAYAAQSAFPDSVYWGDTHLHTNLSFDAFSLTSNWRLGQDEAYRFARGETITGNSGLPAKLRRPLDFLVIAEHAKYMGLMTGLVEGHPALAESNVALEYARRYQTFEDEAVGDLSGFYRSMVINYMLTEQPPIPSEFNASVWASVTAAADRYNQPGVFTAFVGFEWTPTFYNLHRVVLFKDGAAKANRIRPFSAMDSNQPEKLWAYMADYEQATGGEVLAIPHNGNLSSGAMFALEDSTNQDLSSQYAKQRARWEPLYEVVQTKGDGETHPVLSPEDEFADFEGLSSYFVDDSHYDYQANQQLKTKRGFDGYQRWFDRKRSKYGDGTAWMRRYEYARSGLQLGLQQQASLGVNPFKFGLVGGTDAHTSLVAVREENFWGIGGSFEPDAERITPLWAPFEGVVPGWRMNAAGFTGVWAEENTREALFAAMKRKEVYATTGPRMTVRFFGGWDYQSDDAFKPDLAQVGYRKGVPMGGDLARAPKGKAPQFLIRAVKDPDGANLDRVQVIKGWHDKNGELHEKIYNVALSDNRKENRRGKVKPVGNTVNIAEASYANTIGDPELAVVWQDPDFKADELAFYYLRVLEIPTPRWTAYDAKFFKVKEIPDEVPMITQERAYSSPIWYSP